MSLARQTSPTRRDAASRLLGSLAAASVAALMISVLAPGAAGADSHRKRSSGANAGARFPRAHLPRLPRAGRRGSAREGVQLQALGKVILGTPARFRAVAPAGGSPGTLTYSWAWGPNRSYDAPTAEPVVTHIFKHAGPALVELLVTDARGDRVTATRRVMVAAAPRPATDPRSREPLRRAADPSGHAAAAETVVIKDFNFGPPTITVHAGETVTWANQGPSSHTATGHGSFQTGILRPGQSAGHVFTTPGTYSYFCSIHPFMHGTVVVLASVSATPTEHPPASPKAAGGGAERTAAGPELPNTGLNLTVESVSGLGLLALGLLLLAVSRRRLGAVNRRSEPGAKIPPPGAGSG